MLHFAFAREDSTVYYAGKRLTASLAARWVLAGADCLEKAGVCVSRSVRGIGAKWVSSFAFRVGVP